MFRIFTSSHSPPLAEEMRANLKAMEEVMAALSESGTLPAFLKRSLDTIRAVFNWAYGSYWTVDPAENALRFAQDSGIVSEEFRRASQEARFREGVGLSGRAWQSRDLFVARDIGAMIDCPRAPLAKKLGVRTGLCLPIVTNGTIVATIDFFSMETLDLSPERITTLRTLAKIISMGVLKFDSARLTAMLEQSPTNIMFADDEFKIRYLNPASVRTLNRLQQYLPIRVDQIIGQSIDIFHKNPQHQRRLLSDPQRTPHEANIDVGPETLCLKLCAILDPSRKPLGTMLTWEVVTEKVKMEKLVAENAEKSKAAAEADRRNAEELRRKVDSILEVVRGVAEGDFSREIGDQGDDAVGQVGSALNQAMRSIRETLEQVKEVAHALVTASQELSSASTEISSGAQDQASSLEETASSLEEMTATIRQNSDSAQQAHRVAEGSRELAEGGGQVVQSAVEAMGVINQSSKKIADIIVTIDEIAFQTNLLALNAAVEAARAGEQGKGFAVVAAEVRNLAQRSAGAAKEIKALIQDSVRKVESGSDLVNRSGATLTEIVNSVKRVTSIVSEIASASREQSTGIEQINKAVTQMDSITQRNAGQTEELSGTSQALANQAEQLLEVVSRFKLVDAPPVARGKTAKADDSSRPRSRPKKLEMPKGDRFKSHGLNGHDLDAGHAFEEF